MQSPAIIWIIIAGIGLLLAARDHGEPRSNENFWNHALALAISTGLLYWGGFFH